MRKKDKIKLLQFEVTNLTLKLANLSNENDKLIKYTELMETTLKMVLNEELDYNKQIKELKTSNHMLEKEILKKDQLLEIKENQRRKAIGKVSSLTRKLKKIEEEKEGQNEIIKSFAKETRQLKDLVKTNKDARTYLKGKSERE